MGPARSAGATARHAGAGHTRQRMKCTDTRLLTRRQAVLAMLSTATCARTLRAVGAAGADAAAEASLNPATDPATAGSAASRAEQIPRRPEFVEIAPGLFIRSGIDEDAN